MFGVINCTHNLPSNSKIEINTDSLCLLTLNKNFNSYLPPRRFLKINNFQLWDAIKIIINTLKLTVTLVKVKAHSGLPLIILVETPLTISFINHKALNLPLSFVWDPHNTNIDRDIRKTTKTILTHQSFNNFLAHIPIESI
jgi:hypothetical protein